ncbi:MAG TPA: DUF3795 domain-containing protein, partial [Candidatus Acetothermia bacterium]|nr:DUF3795 domain-containing protein [Candidatus Acetothermia bacterium]
MKDSALREERKLIGACGLYCGLCPRFQSRSKSRCEGCVSGRMGAYCGVYRCATKRGYLTCAECPEYPCTRLKRALKIDEGIDSFLSHKVALDNLDDIRKFGMESFLSEQRERRLLARRLIEDYNAGRSITLYCTACALLPTRVITQAIGRLERQIHDGRIDRDDRKMLARQMRLELNSLAKRLDINLS